MPPTGGTLVTPGMFYESLQSIRLKDIHWFSGDLEEDCMTIIVDVLIQLDPIDPTDWYIMRPMQETDARKRELV